MIRRSIHISLLTLGIAMMPIQSNASPRPTMPFIATAGATLGLYIWIFDFWYWCVYSNLWKVKSTDILLYEALAIQQHPLLFPVSYFIGKRYEHWLMENKSAEEKVQLYKAALCYAEDLRQNPKAWESQCKLHHHVDGNWDEKIEIEYSAYNKETEETLRAQLNALQGIEDEAIGTDSDRQENDTSFGKTAQYCMYTALGMSTGMYIFALKRELAKKKADEINRLTRVLATVHAELQDLRERAEGGQRQVSIIYQDAAENVEAQVIQALEECGDLQQRLTELNPIREKLTRKIRARATLVEELANAQRKLADLQKEKGIAKPPEAERCPVCLDDEVKPTISLHENNIPHHLCRTCAQAILNDTQKCPTCRQPINSRLVQRQLHAHTI